jgi:hypothetical protein
VIAWSPVGHRAVVKHDADVVAGIFKAAKCNNRMTQMPTDADRYALLLKDLTTGIEDIRQAFEVAFGVVFPPAATLNEELEGIARAIYAAADRPRPAPVADDKHTTRTHFVYRIDI